GERRLGRRTLAHRLRDPKREDASAPRRHQRGHGPSREPRRHPPAGHEGPGGLSMAGDFTGGAGRGGRKPVDIDMNLIPFIDMMSVLVAFLLLTAVWTNLAQINIKPGGLGHDTEQLPPQQPPINLSILVAQAGDWISV